jgi:hypothetical protein
MAKKPKKTRRKAAKRLIRRASKKKTVKKPKKKARVLKSKKTVKRVKPKKIARKRPKKIIRNKPKKIIKKAKPKKVIRKKVKKAAKKKMTKKKIVKKTKPRKKPRKVKKTGKAKKIKPRKRVKRIRRKKSFKPRVYIGKGALEQLFESQAKVKLLKFFFRNSRGLFQPKEIFKRLRTNPAILRHELSKLENADLLKQKRAWLTFETKSGKIRKEKKLIYYLNPAFDFIHELKNLVLKSTIASKDDLVNSARKLGNIKLLLLAGLFTGDDAARADLLIVGDKFNHRRLNNFVKDLEAEVGRELNCAILSTKEFNYRYDMYDRFVRDLINGKSEILINRINLW